MIREPLGKLFHKNTEYLSCSEIVNKGWFSLIQLKDSFYKRTAEKTLCLCKVGVHYVFTESHHPPERKRVQIVKEALAVLFCVRYSIVYLRRSYSCAK